MRATYCALDATRFRKSPSFVIFPIFISSAGNSSNIWELHRRNLSKNTDRQNEKRQFQIIDILGIVQERVVCYNRDNFFIQFCILHFAFCIYDVSAVTADRRAGHECGQVGTTKFTKKCFRDASFFLRSARKIFVFPCR